MSSPAHLVIRADGPIGDVSVTLNGMEIGNCLRELSLNMKVDDMPTVTMTVVVEKLSMDVSDAMVSQLLRWTQPSSEVAA